MAGLKRRAAAFAALAGLFCAPLSGCYTPSTTSAPDRAIAVYRAAKERRAASRSAAHREDGGTLTLSLERAVELARENSAEVAEMNARVATARALAEEEGQLDNPEIRVSPVQLDRLLKDRPEVSVGLRVPLPRPGEIDAKVAGVRGQERAARAEAEAAARRAEAEARWAFESVQLYDAEIQAAEEEVSARAKLVEAVKARVERAIATRVDEALARMSSAESSQEAQNLRALRAVALGELLDVTGLPASTTLRLEGAPVDTDRLPELPGEEALIEEALKSRPELAIAAARIDAASAAVYIERAKRWPWLSFVQLGYDFEPGVRDGLGWTFSAAVEVPLLSLNNGGAAYADAEAKEAKLAFASEVGRVAREVRELFRQARAARELALSFKGGALPAADEAAEAIKSALDAGQSDMTRVAFVEERRSAVRRRRLDRVRRYFEVVAELRAAVGGRLPNAPPESTAKEPPK